MFVLSLVVLLVLIPGISLSEVFAEKLVVASGKDNPESRFSVIDKITGKEIQMLGDDSGGFLDGIEFSPDGVLFASSNPEQEEASGIVKISFLINNGEPFTTLTEFDGFDNIFCSDIAYAPDGTLYCIQQAPEFLELYKINFEDETSELIGISGTADSEGNGLAVNTDGTIYLGNQEGLYTLNEMTGEATNIGLWNIPDTVLDGCNARAMDFDSLGKLYAAFDCEEIPYLGIIDTLTAEIISMSPITTEVDLDDAFNGEMRTDSIVFFPYDVHFLVGTTYGIVLDGFDSISVSEDTVTGMSISSSDISEVEVCGNTELTIDSSDQVTPTCNDTTTIMISGEVETEFEADNGSGVTTVLVTGDIVTFDSKEFTITNDGENDIKVLFGEKLFTILPGETLSLGSTDHYLGYPAKVKAKHHDDDDDHEDNDDKYSQYSEFLKYFKEHHHDKYKQYEKYLKYFKDNKSDKYEKYFKYAKYFYDKYHGDDDDDKLQVTLTDEFEENIKYDVEKLEKLFNPVDKNGEGIIDEVSHLVGYKIEEAKTDHHDDKYKKYEKYLKYFKDHDFNKYKKYEKYLKYFKDNKSDKYEKYFEYAESYYEKYHNDDDDKHSSHEKHENILVTNQFGDITVDIKKAKMLLVPSSKDHDVVPDELEDITINHFKCYDAKVSKHTPKFEKRTVELKDQFTEEPITMEVKKPKMLCLPVEVTTSSAVYEIEDDENSIMCYELKKFNGKPKFDKQNVFTNNHFGSEELEAKTPNRLCVPSLGEGTDPEPEPEPEIPLATLEIIKTTNNADDNFSITITNNDNDPETYSLTFVSTASGFGSNGPLDLIPENEYTISEDVTTLPPNFNLDTISCVDGNGPIGTTFTPVDGDEIICTVVNEFTAPAGSATLEIIKTTNVDDVFFFTVTSSDSLVDPLTITIPTANGLGSESPFPIMLRNSYTVTEDEVLLPPNFTLDSFDCVDANGSVTTTFTPVDGDKIVCTFDNVFTPPTGTAVLTIVKNTNVDDTFFFDITSSDPLEDQTVSISTADAIFIELNLTAENTYTVTENESLLPPDFTLVNNFDCKMGTTSLGTTFTPANGDEIVCTFENIFTSTVAPTLEIIKNADYDGSFHFTVSTTGGNSIFPSILGTPGGVGTTGPFDLISGNEYTITENTTPSGVVFVSTSCVDGNGPIGTTFTPANGDDIVCIIINTGTPTSAPTLEIIKNADYDGSFNFNISSPSEGAGFLVSLSTPGGVGTTGPLTDITSGNEYTINEVTADLPSGVTLGDIVCTVNGDPQDIGITFTVNNGNAIVCTVTNIGTPTP